MKTTKQLVQDSAELALACKTPQEIKAFIESIGCATQQRWNKAVAAIIEIGGLDYYAAKGIERATSAESLRNQVTHEVELFVDAKARCQRFGICDAAGKVLWYGIFFEDDQSFSYGDRNEQSACECAAARKAIWLASKIKEAAGANAIRLVLNVDAQWLVSGGGKSTVLQSDARRFNIELRLNCIRGTSNPADAWTTASGFKKWSDNDLSKFAMPINPAQEKLNETAKVEAVEIPASVLQIVNPPTDAELAAQKAAEEKNAAAIIAMREKETAEKIERAKIELATNTDRLGSGLRFGCDKRITTFGQFDGCIAGLNRTRATLSMPTLTADEVAAFKAIQNFTNEVATQNCLK